MRMARKTREQKTAVNNLTGGRVNPGPPNKKGNGGEYENQ